MLPELHTLSIGDHAALQPWTRLTITGRTHQLGTVVTYTDAETAEVNAYSLTDNTWLNLVTGRPVGDPRDDADLDLMARYYDARGLAADAGAGRRLAQHRRHRDPASYALAVDHVRRTATGTPA